MQRTIDTQVRDSDLVRERRERIVNAAIAVFRRDGFHNTTTRRLASEAGVTQSNIYNYVKNKDDILYLVCEHLVGLYTDCVDEAVESSSDPYDRVVEALGGIITLMFEHREELLLLYNETHALERADRRLVLKAVSRFIRQFQKLLDDYVEQVGPIRIANRRIAANLLSFVPAVIALRWWDLSIHASQQEAEIEIRRFILAGIGIPETRNEL